MQTNNFILSGYVSGAIDPWFITGFTDAEACFSLRIFRNKELKVGWVVNQSFQISLHQKDKALLEQIQSYFGGIGNITKLGKESLQYSLTSRKDLSIIINHFDKYPLITQKQGDFELFKMAFELIQSKTHLTAEGLAKIVSGAGPQASMNKRLSEELKAAFPEILPVPRPTVVGATAPEIKELRTNWLAGFTTGEGCFLLGVRR